MHFGLFHSRLLIVSLTTILLLLIIPSAPALSYYGAETMIEPDRIVISLTIKPDSEMQSFEYDFGVPISNLTTTGTTFEVECQNQGSIISCHLGEMNVDIDRLKLNFIVSRSLLAFLEGNRIEITYPFPWTVNSSFITFKLPKNSILAEPVEDSFSPPDGRIGSDGQRILVYWERNNVGPDNLLFSVRYSVPLQADPAPDGGGTFIVAIVIIAVVAVASFIYIRKKEPSHIADVLKSDEKTIVDILNKHEGKAYQKVIVRESDFSKAKVSRLVKALESRGIIMIEPVSGRENRIVLKINIQ